MPDSSLKWPSTTISASRRRSRVKLFSVASSRLVIVRAPGHCCPPQLLEIFHRTIATMGRGRGHSSAWRPSSGVIARTFLSLPR